MWKTDDAREPLLPPVPSAPPTCLMPPPPPPSYEPNKKGEDPLVKELLRITAENLYLIWRRKLDPFAASLQVPFFFIRAVLFFFF